MLPIVDTHQHMWDLAQFALPWLEGEGIEPLRKNYLMSDYLAAAEGAALPAPSIWKLMLPPRSALRRQSL